MVFLATPIFWLLKVMNGKTVPPISNEALFLSAKKLAGKIRRRELKAEDVIKMYINRINEVNPLINGVVEDRYSDAILDAKAADAYLDSIQHKTEEMETVRREQPLLGVPLTVKEGVAVKGMTLIAGSLARKHIRAKATGPTIVYLMRAGAIPLCVTNTPEYSFYFETYNMVTGRTRNPYNTAFSVGGSSGGEAALLGAGASLIGVGSDLVGSIRSPAHFTGIFGHKPTDTSTSSKHHFPIMEKPTIVTYLSIGPMTRYAEDLPLMLTIMSGPKAENLRLNDPVDLKTLHVYYLEEFEPTLTLTPVESDIKNCIKKAAKYLQSCGAILHEEKFPMANTLEVVLSLMLTTGEIPHIVNGDNQNDKLGFVPLSKKPYYTAKLEQIRMNFLTTLKDNGVLLMPVFPSCAFVHNSFFLRTSSIMYVGIMNILGFPATSIPMGLNNKKLPIGFQVIATPWNDRLCFAVAQQLEKRFKGWTPPNS
ncbi:PREDICTED: fatty-acid amide hydrolase 2-like [Nicrophorus vespilloides]|uniref:Fatty-acid amide hydrolase 2-like n=1 Tax=Nicrophorus vespilloides TaxID=110193 RepID=A0ABM1N8X6_NICVS|nr:PREDICTED: fatty-acid amide hydrolase 2-like [Nicrophorus vespilloides]